MPVLVPTHTAIKAAKSVASKQVWYSFNGHRGLWLRVLPSGSRTWIFRSRAVDGKTRKAVLGRYPEMSFAEAGLACQQLRQSAGGENPIEAKKSRELAQSLEHQVRQREFALRPTVGAVADKYLGIYVSERRRSTGMKRSASEDRRLFNRHIRPILGSMAVEDLRTRHIAALRDDIKAPSEKRKALSVLKALLSQAKSDGLVEYNFALGIKTPQSGRRERVLVDSEIQLLWTQVNIALVGVRPSMLSAMQLQLLTAQRAGEVLSIRWSDIDREKRTWVIPSFIAKNGRENLVPLSAAAMEIILSQPQVNEYTFSGHRAERVSTSAFAQIVERVRKNLGIPHFTSHDLRRTAATRLGALSVLPHVIEAILNHSGGIISGVAATYNLHKYEIEKRQALESWAAKLKELTAS